VIPVGLRAEGDLTDGQRLAVVRGVHTLIYVVMSASVFVMLYAGMSGASGAWLWPALALVAIESVVFVGNGLRCPFTALARRYSGEENPVSDTFFPERMTRHTFAVFGPMILIGLAFLVVRWVGMFG
jgi:hypothetical protein